MEAPHVYGGDGVKIRDEYAPVNQVELRAHGAAVINVCEDIFESADELETAETGLSSDRSEVYREVHINYTALDDDCTDELVADVKTGEIFLATQPFTPIEKNIIIRHHIFRDQPLREEYIIAIERSVPFTQNAFFAIYTYEFFADGGVQASVEVNKIDTENGADDDTGMRPLTGYDKEQFLKEMAELGVHVSVSTREKRQLASVGDGE